MTPSMEALLVELAHHHAYRALRDARRRNWFLEKLMALRLKASGQIPAGQP